MTEHGSNQTRCFNCARADSDIPLIAWRYRGEALWTCSECMPLLIHKWAQVAATLGEPDKGDA